MTLAGDGGVRLIEIVLPAGGYIVTMAEAYFDESGSHDGSPILCVAGYFFEAEAAKAFCVEWQSVLNRFGLSHFHMTDCANGQGEFKALRMGQRIECESLMIGIIKRYSTFAMAATVNEPEFYENFKTTYEFGTPYSFLAGRCLHGVKQWADTNGFDGDIAYFFESGHRDQPIANRIMNDIASIPSMKKSYRFSSHTFADKKKVLPLQAADLLAWQWFTDAKRKRQGIKVTRKDCQRLIRPVDLVSTWTAEDMVEVNRIYEAYPKTWQERLS